MFAWLYGMMLTSRGRIGRLSYFLRALLIVPLLTAAFIALGVVGFILSMLHLGLLAALIYGVGGLALLVATVWSHVSLATRRYHDFDWSGKWQFVNLALLLVGLVNAATVLTHLGEVQGLATGGGAHLDPQQRIAEIQSAFGGSFTLVWWAINLISLGMWAHLQFRPGTAGENRYDGESRLPSVFGPNSGAPAGKRAASPVGRPNRTAPTRSAATYDGEPRETFGLRR